MTEKAPKDIVESINEKCVGHPSARIAWPHRILHEAAAEITRLREALASTEVFADKVGATCNQNADERDRLRAREAELMDKIDGIDSDLRAAVEVAFKRGATEWTRLNYPDWYRALTAQQEGDGDD